MACPLSFLQQYSVSGLEFLECIFTGDKAWVYHHIAETNAQVWNGNTLILHNQKISGL
jgi:hypothetical protein